MTNVVTAYMLNRFIVLLYERPLRRHQITATCMHLPVALLHKLQILEICFNPLYTNVISESFRIINFEHFKSYVALIPMWVHEISD